jgi:flagellin-like hook-associated protein FlgL
VTRIKDAVAEIKTVSRNNPVAAAEGAARLIERLSPALEHVDSSSGALGTAVNRVRESRATFLPAVAARSATA